MSHVNLKSKTARGGVQGKIGNRSVCWVWEWLLSTFGWQHGYNL